MAKRTALNVRLSSDQRAFVRKQVRAGRYTSESEVLREGLRRLEEDERFVADSVSSLRKKIAEGLADVKAGRLVDGPSVFARIREMSKARRKKVA
ncbi:MAG: type II toxin-antitoxin system ParD family antitoxin [Phycisphaerales bacterium]